MLSRGGPLRASLIRMIRGALFFFPIFVGVSLAAACTGEDPDPSSSGGLPDSGNGGTDATPSGDGGGTCTPACAADQICCGNACVKADENNCFACGTKCEGQQQVPEDG
jgi:hypothetical protein